MANQGLKTYSADEVLMVFAGIPLTSGLADGTFVKVEQDEDSFSLYVGSDGEATRAKNNNRSHTITFTLTQTSDANELLSALHTLDINTPGGAGVGPLLIADKSGRAVYVAETAWIQKPPAREFGREVGTREWTIRTNNLVAKD